MEVNKDEAYRCLDRAQNYLDEGDMEKAEKFINKSKKLFPTFEADGEYNYLFLVIFLLISISFFLYIIFVQNY